MDITLVNSREGVKMTKHMYQDDKLIYENIGDPSPSVIGGLSSLFYVVNGKFDARIWVTYLSDTHRTANTVYGGIRIVIM